MDLHRTFVLCVLSLSACSPAVGFVDGNNNHDGNTNWDAASDGNNADVVRTICTGTSTPSVLSGHTYAPNRMDPIPNVFVAVVPDSQTFPAPPSTVQCQTCANENTSYPNALASTHSGPDGSFSLQNAMIDAGGTYTIVFEIGGFRHVQRHVSVGMCTPLMLTAMQTSLPGATSGDDAIPRILVAGYRTGVSTTHDVNDHFTHVLDSIGITGYDTVDPDKTGTNGGTGPDLLSVLNNMSALSQYQIVVTPCGSLGNFTVAPNVSTAIASNLRAWLGMGGRLYASDLAYSIVDRGYPGAITFAPGPSSRAGADPADEGVGLATGTSLNATVDDLTLRSWLQNVGVIPSGATTIPIQDLKDPWGAIGSVPDSELMPVMGVQTGVVLVSGDVMWHDGSSGHHPLTVMVDYAAPGAGNCGRVVFTSYHVQSTTSMMLSPQERVLEFLFFRLSTCIETPG